MDINQIKRDAQKKELEQKTVDPNLSYGEKIKQGGQLVREQIKYDQDIYGEGLNDKQIQQINKGVSDYVSQGETLEDMQSRSFRMGQAMLLSNKLEIPLDEAMEQIDSIRASILGTDFPIADDVGTWNALKNSFQLGINQIVAAHYGNMMSLNAALGNNSGYDDYMLKLESLQRENEALQDPIKRNIAVEALKYGAQSAPFSFGTQALSFIPEVGPALSFGASAWNSYGSLYADFRQKGAGHKESLGVATVAAGLDAFIEVSLGELAVNGAGKLGEKVFTKVVGKSREQLVEGLTKEVFKHLKYNGALDNLLKESTKFVGGTLEEGFEEVLQYWNDELADAVVAGISKDYDLEQLGGAERCKKIVRESAENFKGGFLGALAMGIPMQVAGNIGNAALTKANIEQANKILTTVDSKVEAERQLANNPIFANMDDSERLQKIDDLYDKYQFMRDLNYTEQAEELSEITQPAEGFADVQKDENGDIIKEDVYRNKGGELHVQDDVRETEDGVIEGTYKVGDPTKKAKNLDGYIDYTLDEKTHTVEINKFVMSEAREDIRAEFYERFARDFAGYDIKWDPEGQRAIDLKETLIKANPNGKNNGLSYYTDEVSVADINTRKNVANQIKAAMPKLSNSQIATNVALLETVYKSLKDTNGYNSFTDYVQKTFGENIFGDKSVLEESAKEQNGNVGVRGGVSFKQTEKGLRAIIYASEKADFSTFSHEIAHVFRQQLQGDLLAQAEKAFNVENGQWTRDKEEAFAVGFEQFLRTGKVKNSKLANLFQKIAEFMARVYGTLRGYIKFNPDVESVYNEILSKGDDSVLALAEKAVRENDKIIRQEEQKYAQEQKETAAKQKAQEDFEASETNYVDTEETVEEETAVDKEIKDIDIKDENGHIDPGKLKEVVDLIENQDTDNKFVIDNKTQNTLDKLDSINPEVAKEIQNILTDPASSITDKQDAINKASAILKENNIQFFQLMHTDAIQYIASERVRGEIAGALKKAIEYKAKGLRESYIASMTSWRNVNGEWIYEFSDNGIHVHLKPILETLKEMKARNLETFNGFDKVTLEMVMDHQELYDKFPEMKDLKVKFVQNDQRIKSLYDPKTKSIYLNLKNRDLRMSLVAACQRYIQSLTNDLTDSYKTLQEVDAEYKYAMDKFVYEKMHGLKHDIDSIPVNEATKAYLKDRLNQEVIQTAYRWRKSNGERAYNGPGLEKDSLKMYFQSEAEQKKLYNKNMENSKGIYLAANKARHDNYNMDYNDYDPKYKTNIVGDMLDVDLTPYDYIIATPPCNYWSKANNKYKTSKYALTTKHLLPQSIEKLAQTGKPFIVENVKNYKRMEEGEVFDVVRKYDLYLQNVGRHIYITNVLGDYTTEQVQDFDKDGNFINKGSNRQGGDNVHKVIDKWIDNVMKNIDLSDPKESLQEYNENQSIMTLYQPEIDTSGRKSKNGTGNTKAKRNNNSKGSVNLLLQSAYHGSAANFDKFNTDEYGFSGEGSMSFGYGTYVSGSEEIARDYAERQFNNKNLHTLEEALDILKENVETSKKELESIGTYEDWYKEQQEDIERRKKEVAFYESQGKDVTWKKNLLKFAMEQDFEEEYKNKVSSLESTLNSAKKQLEEKANEYIEAQKKGEVNKNLYTVDIPDKGYIKWDRKVRSTTLDKVQSALFKKLAYEPDIDGSLPYQGVESELRRELNDVFNSEYTGQSLYGTLESYLGSDKEVSKFLNKLGYKGIDYPAYSNFGNAQGKEARNYVIFNDDDAKIVDHMLFQTEQELYDDARMFDNWQDFMEFYEQGFGKPEVTLVPEDPDAAWYQTTWEMAHNIKPESQENEEYVKAMVEADKASDEPAEAKDALFLTKLSRPGVLEDFLSRIYDIRNMNEDLWGDVATEEDALEREKYTELKDYADFYLKHGTINSNSEKVANGKELKESERQKLISLMTNNVRNYREAYAKIMGDSELEVDITKEPGYQKYRLSDPENNFVRKSFAERKRLSEQAITEGLAEEIRNGKFNGNLDKYIELFDNQIKEAEKGQRAAENKLKELHMEVDGDYQTISDWETRRLLEVHDKLLLAKGKLTNHSNELARRLERGLKITGKYDKMSENLKASYNTIFRKFEDLRKTIEISEQVKAALQEREKYVDFKDKAQEAKHEKSLVDKAKKMRIQLVKRTMRRVPFQRINYDQARTLIAIQRALEPNLLGGVNKWIGQDNAYLRGVISAWITDEAERTKLEKYLSKKGTKTSQYILEKLKETKTIDDFNAWTKQDREKAHRILPKENWIRELNLEQLAEERERSIQLDMETTTETRTVTDEKGKVQTLVFNHVTMSPELEQEIKEALGDKLYNQVMTLPFSDWTTEQMEELAKRVDDIYIEGRNLLAAKRQILLEEADNIRKRIEAEVKKTGIFISDDDDDETKKKKQAKIDKILGKNNVLKGTSDGKVKYSLLDKIAFGDANMLRVSRILDNYSEGVNVEELHKKENYCFNDKARAIDMRSKNIEKVMKDNKITAEELTDYYKLGDYKFTVDELLYIRAANADYEEDLTKKKADNPAADPYNLAQNDDYAPTSRNAVMFGNMLSSSRDLDFKEECRQEDEDMQRRIEKDELTADEKNLKILGMLITKPGTKKYIDACKQRYTAVLNLAFDLDKKYDALIDAINRDYSDQYERMNKASIEVFNIPVNRIKSYVPLVRLESNGDTNENRVREDLLGAMGASKQWVDKGMTQSRINIGPLNQKPVETGLYKTWTSSVERTEHFIAYSPYVNELNRVYKSRDAQYLRGFIQNRYGKGMLHYIDDYINEVANPNPQGTRSALDNMVRVLRGKTAPAYLAWKTSGIIKQAATSPWPYMQFVNPAKYLKACFDIIKSKGKLYDDIKELSPYMNSRVMDPMIDVINENLEKSNNPFSYSMNKFGKIGMQGLEWIDWACVSPGWLACYRDKHAELTKDNNFKYDQLVNELTEKNDQLDIISPERMTEEQIKAKAMNMTMTEGDIKLKAVEYADECTRACQPSNRAVDLAPLFKSRGPGSEVGKALLQFQTSLNVIWQNIRYDLQYEAKNIGKTDIPMGVKKKLFGQMLGTIFAYVFAGILMNAVTQTPDDDDDDKDKLKKYIWYGTTQFTDSIPVIGQATSNFAEQMITGKKSFGNSGIDLFPTATKFTNAATSARTGNWDKATKSFVEGLAMSQGMPVSGMKEALWAVGIGDNDGELDFKPDALIGRRRKEKKSN